MAMQRSGGRMAGKVAVVTGASRGIGAAIAARFGSEGATVVLAARTVAEGDARLPGTLPETARAVERAGGAAVVVPTDVAVAAERERLIATAESEAGPVDVLVNNAAVTYFVPCERFDLRHYDLMFEVQVKASMHLAQLVLPSMRARGQGWIVNISSGAARHPTFPPQTRLAGVTVYGMCKAALERFTTGLAAEVYESGIAVNALLPAQIVPTPGTIFHGLVRPDDPAQQVEPPGVMAEAAVALATAPGVSLTGRIVTSAALLAELGWEVPTTSEPDEQSAT